MRNDGDLLIGGDGEGEGAVSRAVGVLPDVGWKKSGSTVENTMLIFRRLFAISS
jgi:hypothetical protein